MLQPFVLFEKKYLPRLQELRKRFLVSQSYPRGVDHFDELRKVPLLLTDYSDDHLAKVHLHAVKADRYAAIIDLLYPPHLAKLQSLLEPSSRYRVFWSVFSDRGELEQKINGKYRDHMMRYIKRQLQWQISGKATVSPKVEVIFGELHLTLKYGNYDRVRVKFEEIEMS